MMFKDKLKGIMIERGMNNAALAKTLGVAPASIGYYLSGRVRPPERKQAQFALALGLDVDFFKPSKQEKPKTGVSDVKITFVKACRCLRKSEDAVRKLTLNGCAFGIAVPGRGDKLNYIFYPDKFRELVGPERFDTFFSVAAE